MMADGGLQQVLAIVGNRNRLASALNLRPQSVRSWTCVPQGRVFEVAALTGLPPAAIRPDLADELAQEERRRTLAADKGALSLAALGQAVTERWQGPEIEEFMVDLWSSLASATFVARLRGLSAQQVYRGATKTEEAARAYAMALAKVVGRARSTNVAGVYGCSRQNVDNAAERYLRGRDGDDPEDYIRGQFPDQAPRVFEPGSNRLRRAKAAVEGLWEIERQFEAFLTGQTPTLPERKRA